MWDDVILPLCEPGTDNLPTAERERRCHPHVYLVSRVQFCLAACCTAHLNDSTQAHHTQEYVASSRARAEAWIRGHATDDPTMAWEVWEEAVDGYMPYEEADDDGEFWQYNGRGEALTSRQWYEQYEHPLYGWTRDDEETERRHATESAAAWANALTCTTCGRPHPGAPPAEPYRLVCGGCGTVIEVA